MFKPFKSFGETGFVQGSRVQKFKVFGSESAMNSFAKVVAWALVMVSLHSTAGAETLEQLIAGAKKESELTFIAGAQTFGGQKTLNILEAAFNKRFGLNMKIRFAAGPEMNSMAARVITEVKNGSKASSDLYHGSQSHLSLLHKEKVLEQVNYSGIFPWITKPMEIFPSEGVLIFTSLRGMIYNSNLIPKDKAPKTYEDLVDPKLSPMWAGKLAIPPYVSWLVELSMIWSEDKVKNFTQKIGGVERRAVALQRRRAGGQRRISHRGEYGRGNGTNVAVAGQGRAAGGGDGIDTGVAVLLSTSGAEKFGPSEFGQAVRRFHGLERSPGHTRKK